MFTTFMQPWPMVPSDAGEKSEEHKCVNGWMKSVKKECL